MPRIASSRRRLAAAVLSVLALSATGLLAGAGSAQAASPSVPQNVTSDQITAGSVEVGWQVPANFGTDPAVSYTVTVGPRTVTVADNAEPVSSFRGTSVDGLPLGTFAVSVTATNADGTSPAATTSVTVVPVPSAPRHLVLRPTGPTQVTITWDEPLDAASFPIDGYGVGYTGPDRGDYTGVSGDQRSIVIDGLLTPGTYHFGVSARVGPLSGVSARGDVVVGAVTAAPVPVATPAPAKAAPAAAPTQLPRTGSRTGGLAAVALALLVVGSGLTLAGRRRLD